MKAINLFFLIFFAIIGLNCPLIANAADDTHLEAGENPTSGVRRKFFAKFRFPKINRRSPGKDTYSIEILSSKLLDLEAKRKETRNPFIKLRCYIQELKIRRKLRRLIREKEEEEKLERLEEEFPVDYSPDILSEEVTVIPQTRVTAESSKDKALDNVKTEGENFDEETIEESVKEDEVGSEQKDDESTNEDIEAEDLSTGISEAVISEGDTGESENTESSDKAEAVNAIPFDDVAKVAYRAQDTKSLKEKCSKKTRTEADGTLCERFRERVRAVFRKKTTAEALEKLFLSRSELNKKLETTKNGIMKRILESKLKSVESKISKLTTKAIDEVDIIDTQ